MGRSSVGRDYSRRVLRALAPPAARLKEAELRLLLASSALCRKDRPTAAHHARQGLGMLSLTSQEPVAVRLRAILAEAGA